MRKPTIAGVLAAAALLLPLAACGSEEPNSDVASVGGSSEDSGTNGASTGEELNEEDIREAMREFAGCMREHGVDMPDPDPDSGAMVAIPGAKAGEDNSKLAKADEACRALLPNGGERPEISPEELDKLREEAKCLREHGIDVKDPTQENPGMGIAVEPGDEKFEKAVEACGMGTAGGRSVTIG